MSAERCPYHIEPTPAEWRLTYTYAAARVSIVDTICARHLKMHTDSLRAAASVEPVSVERITR